jgi:hypothetical protein
MDNNNNIISIQRINNLDNIEKEVVKETANSFYQKVDDLVWQKDISYYDAVCEIMVKNDYDPEFVAKLVNAELKAKLQIELEQKSLVQKSGTKRLF